MSEELVIGDRVCIVVKGKDGYITQLGRMLVYVGGGYEVLDAVAVKIDGEDDPLWVERDLVRTQESA